MKTRIYLMEKSDPGLIAKISFIMSKSRINIEDINMINLGDKTYIDLEVTNENQAISVLKANGFNPMSSNLIMVQLQDKPGELAKITDSLLKEGVKINRIDVIAKGPGTSILAFDVDKPRKVKVILKEYIV